MFSGVEPIVVPEIHDSKLPKDLAPELASFLVANNLQDRYNKHIENQTKFKQLVSEYDLEKDADGSIAKDTLIPAFAAYVLDGLSLGEPFIKARTEEFKKFDFKGDLTVAKDWEPFKELGRVLTYFPTENGLFGQSDADIGKSLGIKYFLSFLEDKVFTDKLKGKYDLTKALPADAFDNFEAALEEYGNTINASVTEEDLHPALKDDISPKEKRNNLKQILFRSCLDRVGKILTGTPVASEDRKFEITSVSVRGAEIINGLDKAIESIAKLDSANSLESWHNYLSNITSALTRSDDIATALDLLHTDIFTNSYAVYSSFKFKTDSAKAVAAEMNSKITSEYEKITINTDAEFLDYTTL